MKPIPFESHNSGLTTQNHSKLDKKTFREFIMSMKNESRLKTGLTSC